MAKQRSRVSKPKSRGSSTTSRASKPKARSTDATRRAGTPVLDESTRKRAKFLSQLWLDPEFKARFLANPKQVLREADINYPEGIRIIVVEDTPDTVHVVIPHRKFDALIKTYKGDEFTTLTLPTVGRTTI